MKARLDIFVFNAVVGDGRVLRCAEAARQARFDVRIIGVSKTTQAQQIKVSGIPTLLLPNPAFRLKTSGLWGPDAEQRDISLLLDGVVDDLARALTDDPPAILHSNDLYGLPVAARALLAALTMGCPVPDIAWLHDLHEYVGGLTTIGGNHRGIGLVAEEAFIAAPGRLLTVSGALASTVSASYPQAAKPTVILNAPAVGATAPGASDGDVRSALGLARDVPLAVFVGVAKPERGCDDFVDVVSLLDDWHLCFITNPSAYTRLLRARAREAGVTTRTHFHPYVPHECVVRFIRTASVGVHGLTHYPNAEVALPNKLFEYLQAQLPVVTSDVAAMQEFVVDTGIGRVYRSGDIAGLGAALAAALDGSTEHRRAMTPSLRHRYSWNTQSALLIAAYRTTTPLGDAGVRNLRRCSRRFDAGVTRYRAGLDPCHDGQARKVKMRLRSIAGEVRARLASRWPR